jgi:hypothetical protein
MDPGRRALYDNAGAGEELDYYSGVRASCQLLDLMARTITTTPDDGTTFSSRFIVRLSPPVHAEYDSTYRGSNQEAVDVLY